jgi:membrane peptidoglycan carboxypeptidase
MRRPLFLIGLAMLAGVAGLGVMVSQTSLPEFESLEQASYICASDVAPGECSASTAMTRVQADENRTNVSLDEVPDVVVDAVLAMEDRDFFEHDGIQPMGIARALFQNVKGGTVTQGGSTITQQFVKNAFKLSRERAISRKIKEAVLSIKLEQQMSKEEILEGYLNTIFFGRGAYGIGAASRAYFGIDVREISDPGQAALLAGVIRAPALAEPTAHPDEAARRRKTALVAMQQEGYITAEQVSAADAQPVAEPWVRPFSGIKLTETLRYTSDEEYRGLDYLSQYVAEELMRLDERFDEATISSAGLRIYTSLDYGMQKAAWDAVVSTLPNEDDPATPEYEGDPEAALVAVDDQGQVKAMVGSRHRFTPEVYELNYALRGREPGSTFKPIVLAKALSDGVSLKSRYDSVGTITFDEPDVLNATIDPWKVSNYSESDKGVMDLIGATNQSSNTAYAQLMIDLGLEMVDPDGNGKSLPEGPQEVAELAESMGVGGGDIPEEHTGPAMVLGTVNATPLEMAGVYSTFANRGIYRRPDIITRVEQVDQNGGVTVLYQRQVREKRVLSETTADLVNHTLQTVLQPGGTGQNANIGKPAAGKTGTSQQNKNAWFAGYVPRLTAVVWMGHPKADYLVPGSTEEDPQYSLWPMNFESGRPVQGRVATGGSFPATIWKKFMEVVTAEMNDPFVEVTPEQIALGTVLNRGLLTPEEQATTVPPPEEKPPPPPPGRPGRPRDTTTLPATTETTDPQDTTTTTTSVSIPGPPGHDG